MQRELSPLQNTSDHYSKFLLTMDRGEQKENSDVDVCVDMAPDMYLLVALKQFLERLLGCSVDVIRMHRNMNKLLLKQIERDGVYVF